MKHLPSIVLAFVTLGLLGMGGQDAKPTAPATDQVAPAPDVDAPAATRRPIYGETIQLFNGKNLDNWTAFSIGSQGTTDPTKVFFKNKNGTLERTFVVEDGILKCRGLPIGYIRTKQNFTSYHLAVEWRFDKNKGGGNSGILMRIISEDKVWPRCIEAQLHSRNAGDIWNIEEFPMKTTTDKRRISGRRTKKAAPSNENPLGEWNRYDITLDGEHLELKVNGLVQNVATECGIFAGPIGLQSEGVWIEVRKLELKPIIGHE